MSRKNVNNYYDNSEGYENNQEYVNYNNLNYEGNDNYYYYDKGNNQYTNNYYENNYNNNYYQNDYNNNYYENNNYNNNAYGKILHYYNNYPVYASIPASVPNSSNKSQNINNEEIGQSYSKNISKKISTDSSTLEGKIGQKSNKPKAVPFKIRKEDICHLRPPEYRPGYIPMPPGKPAYAYQPYQPPKENS
jgi:hypothetical protein